MVTIWFFSVKPLRDEAHAVRLVSKMISKHVVFFLDRRTNCHKVQRGKIHQKQQTKNTTASNKQTNKEPQNFPKNVLVIIDRKICNFCETGETSSETIATYLTFPLYCAKSNESLIHKTFAARFVYK